MANSLDKPINKDEVHSAIKKVGIFSINIKLHAEVTCELKINVATSLENANLQKKEANKPEQTAKDDKKEITSEDKKIEDQKKITNTKKVNLKKEIDPKTVEIEKKEEPEVNSDEKDK